MWNYEKRLQYPVKISLHRQIQRSRRSSSRNSADLTANLPPSMRYLAQRYTMPYNEVTGTLTDIGTEN